MFWRKRTHPNPCLPRVSRFDSHNSGRQTHNSGRQQFDSHNSDRQQFTTIRFTTVVDNN